MATDATKPSLPSTAPHWTQPPRNPRPGSSPAPAQPKLESPTDAGVKSATAEISQVDVNNQQLHEASKRRICTALTGQLGEQQSSSAVMSLLNTTDARFFKSLVSSHILTTLDSTSASNQGDRYFDNLLQGAMKNQGMVSAINEIIASLKQTQQATVSKEQLANLGFSYGKATVLLFDKLRSELVSERKSQGSNFNKDRAMKLFRLALEASYSFYDNSLKKPKPADQ